LGKTPLISDPRMTYDKYYEDALTRQAKERYKLAPPASYTIKKSNRPNPSLGGF
jgi:hypothetical protein